MERGNTTMEDKQEKKWKEIKKNGQKWRNVKKNCKWD